MAAIIISGGRGLSTLAGTAESIVVEFAVVAVELILLVVLLFNLLLFSFLTGNSPWSGG